MTIADAPTLRSRSAENPRLTFGTALASEWKKLLTLRSTYVSALVMLVLTGLMVLAVAGYADPKNAGALGRADVITSSTLSAGLSFNQLVIGVLAVLIVSSEYSTGMIQSTLASTPRRLYVLGSKAIISAVSAIVLGIAAWLVSAAVAIPLLTSKGFAVDLTSAPVIGSLGTVVVYLVIVALFGTFLGFIVRSSAAGIAVVVAVMFVLPTAASLLPASVDLGSFGLSDGALTLAYSLANADVPGADLGKAAIVTIIWLGALAAFSVSLFKRRDA